jgi:bifunctional enzyme CysN/CysC
MTTPHSSEGAVGLREQEGRSQQTMNLVVTGHVDHGKSTIVGRLLAETGSLPDGKLEAIRAHCARNAKPFEYAFLLDALRDERAQGITIDAARVFFRSARREYILIDVPGHSEFLRNMITGAARAEAAVLVIDGREGVQDNTRRHGYLLSMLRIRQLAVVVNKMDLVGRSQEVFERIVHEYGSFLAQLQLEPSFFVPASGMTGENIVARSPGLSWYTGPTVLEALDAFQPEPRPVDAPFRMPVQGVYKFTAEQDERRIVAGTVSSGRIQVGDEIVFLPSGKKTRVKTIEGFNRPLQTAAQAGEATGLTLADQIYVERGEMATRHGETPMRVSTRFRASVVWLGRDPFEKTKEYRLKLGSARVPVQLEDVHHVIDATTLNKVDGRERVERHEVADCTLSTRRPIAFDCADVLGHTSRFVLVDGFQIAGGGVIHESLADRHSWVRERVLRRENKWTHSLIAEDRRAERYGQRPGLLLITGAADTDRKALARELEERLFSEGRFVYFLTIGNVLYGVDSDIERSSEHRSEHLRRLGEVANILLHAGLIVVASAAELTAAEVELLQTSVGQRVWTAWIGDTVTTDLVSDLLLPSDEVQTHGVSQLKQLLQDQRLIYRPW